MDEYWYDYVSQKNDENTKHSQMDTRTFTVNVNTNDIYNDIAEYVETRFDTANYELNSPFPKGKYKKAIGSMKNELTQKDLDRKEFIKSNLMLKTQHRFRREKHNACTEEIDKIAVS